jgi:hypothetical protein
MSTHSIRDLIVVAVFTATTMLAAAPAFAASFDGSWSVTIVTRSGPCDASYRYGVVIQGGRVASAGGGGASVAGRVSSSGQVSVSVAAGSQSAHGSGRLSHGRGSGTWRGHGPTGTCAGVWSATQG